MTTKTSEELAELLAEGGPDALKAYYEAETKNVFGHDYKRDPKNGKPIEMGIGSAMQPSENSVRAYERFHKDDAQYAATLARLKSELAAFEAKRGRE